MTRGQIFGRYELLQRISAGGMAEVFHAIHLPSGTHVALKRILPEISEDEEFIQMFEDEARIASHLEHPHIARCLDFGRVDDTWFISFEYVAGKDLRTIFDRANRTGEKPPIWFILYVFSRIGEGLAYAHARKDPTTGAPVSIVHRDVSPQNIVVAYNGDVKLIDFGIAKAAGKLSRTQVGTIKGKFGYMSPEQAAGKEVDARADVFGMGICLWELLTSKRLFFAENELLVLEKIRSTTVQPPSQHDPQVPPELDRVVLKALAKDPDERYRSARELYKDLNHLAQNHNVVASREQIAHYMRRAFPEAQASGASDARQETRSMAADNKGGSDLDIFEGLAKKNSRPSPGATPAPPPARGSSSAPQQNGGPYPQARPIDPAKKTLVGIQAPSSQSGMPAARSAPPPPPGRGSLPPVMPPPQRASRPTPPPSVPPRGGTQAMPQTQATNGPAAQAKGGLEMDWDDEDEATHIFDKEESKVEPPPRAPKPNLNQTMPLAQAQQQGNLGMTMPLAQGAYPQPAPSGRVTPPPAPPSVRTPPPPPPSVGSAFARGSSVPAPPHTQPAFPPPPGQMRQSQPPPAPPSRRPPPPAIQPADPYARAPQPQMQQGPYVAPASLPPPNRMEATALVRPQKSSAGLIALLVAAVVIIAGAAAAIVLWPKNGKLVVNVSDAKGTSVAKAEIFVDGRKVCDTTPCIVDPVAAGSRNVKVLAQGYDQPSDKTVNVEARKETLVDFSLGQAASKKTGTGLRVSGKQVGVKLFVDGKEIGPLPQELTDLTPGDHTVKIAGSDRYAPIEKSVIIAKDEMQDLGDQQLKVVKGKATINLSTPGAKVYLVSGNDRRELPTLPISVDIDTSKQWSLEASKPAYDDFKQPISFDDGQAEKTFDVSLHLKGAPATPTATHTATPVPPVAPTNTTPETSETTAPTATAPEPSKEPGFLNINSIPPSTCFLDGRALGNTPRAHVQVSPGSHIVKFVNSELGLTKTIGVTVGPGETKLAAVKLN